MPATTRTRIPDKLTAGDSLTWEKTWSDYPSSDGWAVATDILSTATDLGNFAAVEGAAGVWKTTIAAATTAAWAAGTYYWKTFATDSGESVRETLEEGCLVISADFGTASTIDNRTHAVKMLASIEAMIEGTASLDQQSYSIGDRSLTRLSKEELQKWRDYYRAEVAKENRKKRQEAGLAVSSKVKTRFTG